MTDLCKLEFDWKTQTASLFVDVNKIANEVAEQLDEEVLRVIGFEKIKHGRWETVSAMLGYLCCSECKDVYIWETWLGDGKWNYCPNCGAKMDKNENT